MLRDLIRSELLSDKLCEISPEVIENLSKDITETLSWCLSRNEREICLNFKNIVDEFVKAYPLLRIFKYLNAESSLQTINTVDKEILNAMLQVVKRFFEALVKGAVMHDNTVPVVVRREITLRGRVIPKGAFILLNASEALILEAASYVSVLIP
ncbi:MAG: hypothetical protein J7L51_00440 [Desulfurococcales archaeon]|nr:hypothetical protein [Desulfurococcales archaeon]